jgi:hypothetical protein
MFPPEAVTVRARATVASLAAFAGAAAVFAGAPGRGATERAADTTPAPILQVNVPPQLTTGQEGRPLAEAVNANGGVQPYSWSATGLPAGLSIRLASSQTNSSVAYIQGTPTRDGTFSVTVKVSDGSGQTSTADATLWINGPPMSVPQNVLKAGVEDRAYTGRIEVDGGMPPFSFLSQGPLPPGLQLDGQTGEVTGDPTQSGTFTIAVEIKDSSPQPQLVTVVVAVTVTPPLKQVTTVTNPTTTTVTRPVTTTVTVTTTTTATTTTVHTTTTTTTTTTPPRHAPCHIYKGLVYTLLNWKSSSASAREDAIGRLFLAIPVEGLVGLPAYAAKVFVTAKGAKEIATSAELSRDLAVSLAPEARAIGNSTACAAKSVAKGVQKQLRAALLRFNRLIGKQEEERFMAAFPHLVKKTFKVTRLRPTKIRRATLTQRYADFWDAATHTIYELKVGSPQLTARIKQEIAADCELLTSTSKLIAAQEKVERIYWVFVDNPLTGQRGPDPALRAALSACGIGVALLAF